MLKLLTTDAFATWFSALPSAPAEDVAATLEVIVQLGTRTEAPGSSDALLWYEHPSVAGKQWPDYRQHFPPEIIKFTQDWGHFTGYVRRVVKHLESPSFVARLARLAPENAATVAEAVKRIRRASTTRFLASSEFSQKKRYFIGKQPTAADLATLAGFLDETEVRGAYFTALAAAGFEVVDVPPQSGAVLREISLRATPPGLRLLYGLDEPNNRGLVVLGEWLDRSFYGDSVRLAEKLWSQFLGGEPLSTQPASVR